jgi:hypothetical protein
VEYGLCDRGVAEEDLDCAGGKTCLGEECGYEMLDTEGSFFGGFDDDGVSCCEGGSEFFDGC